MRAFRRLLSAVLLGLASVVVQAQNAPVQPPPPAEQYLRVCEIISRGDRGFTTGDQAEALTAYREAAQALDAFRKQYPGYNTALVDVRVKHVGDRLKLLEQNPPGAAALAAIAPTPAAPPGPLPMPLTADVTNEFRTVLRDLRAAEADNAMLLAKLREALASTPALLDPRELQRAEQNLAALKDENAQLRKQLESALAPSPTASTTGGSAESKRLRREIEDLNRKLKAQAEAAVQLLAEKTVALNRQADELSALKARAAGNAGPALAALESENAALKQKLQAASASADSGQTALAQLAAAQGQLTEAKSRIESLQRELEGRPAVGATADIERLTNENRSLQAQLGVLQREQAEATQKSAAALTTQGQEAARELAAARAEVAALQQARAALEQQLAAAPKPEVVAELRTRNDDLQRQLTDANTRLAAARSRDAVPPPSSITPAELAALRERAQAAEAGSVALRSENTRLQQQATLASQQSAKDVARIRDLESRLSDVEKQLAEAERQVTGRSARSLEKKINGLNEDVLELRARLNVYETKAVPYTKEELALFKKPAPNQIVAPKTLPSKSGRGMTANLQTRGEQQLAAGDLGQAEQTLTQVVQVNEREVRALCNLANSQAGQGKLTEAEATIQRALTQAPNDPSSLAVLSFIRYSQNRIEEAFDAASRAAKLAPKDGKIQVLLGVILAEKGMRSQAETAFRKALQLQPNDADAHRNLAVIYLTQKPPRVEMARWHYQKAVANGSPPSTNLERDLDAATAAPSQ
jgi:Flp pilus assembly protein TadD